jgi:hypothetical protein
VIHERARRYPLRTWAQDELLRLDKGYVPTKFELARSSPAVDHTLRQLRLRQNCVQEFAVERARDFHAVPNGEFKLAAGNDLIVYGARDAVERLLQPGKDQTLGSADRLLEKHPGTQPYAENPIWFPRQDFLDCNPAVLKVSRK